MQYFIFYHSSLVVLRHWANGQCLWSQQTLVTLLVGDMLLLHLIINFANSIFIIPSSFNTEQWEYSEFVGWRNGRKRLSLNILF